MRVLLAFLLSSCVDEPKIGPPSVAPPSRPSPNPALPSLRGWPRLPLLPEGADVPEYDAARLAWRTATTAYARGDAIGSADAFLDVASRLRRHDSPPIDRTFASGRCLAYENAGKALLNARAFALARARLEEITDPACAHSIAGTLEPIAAAQPSRRTPMWRSIHSP